MKKNEIMKTKNLKKVGLICIYLQYKRKFKYVNFLVKGLQFACERLAEVEANEDRQAFKRLARCLQKACKWLAEFNLQCS